jgi:hypothetical protein
MTLRRKYGTCRTRQGTFSLKYHRSVIQEKYNVVYQHFSQAPYMYHHAETLSIEQTTDNTTEYHGQENSVVPSIQTGW